MYSEILKIRASRNSMEKIAQQIHIYPGAPAEDADLKAHLIEAMQQYADADAAHRVAQEEKELGFKRVLHLLGGMALGGGIGAGIGAAIARSGSKGSAAGMGGMLGIMPGAIVGAVRGNNESERLYPGVADRKLEAWGERQESRDHLKDLAILDPKLYERQRLLSGISNVPRSSSLIPTVSPIKPITEEEEEI
jgi:hypothetical protein